MIRTRLFLGTLLAAVLVVAALSPASATPGSRLDLNNWKLTIPIDANNNGAADEIKQPQLNTYSSDWLFDNPNGDGVVFHAPVAGTPGTATTSGSSYLRAELREMFGSQEAAWLPNDGFEHTMTLRQAVVHVPAVKPDVVVAQIHDTGNAAHKAQDVIEVKLSGKRLFLEFDSREVGLLDASYDLGTPYTVVIKANYSGVSVSYNGVQKLSGFLPNVTYGPWYFKAGAYTHSSTAVGAAPGDFGESIIYALSVQHAPIACGGRTVTIQGTAGPDRIVGTDGPDVIAGGGGNDVIYGLGGNDVICGNSGRDSLRGGAGLDKLIGGTGRDVCRGGAARDRAKGCERAKSL